MSNETRGELVHYLVSMAGQVDEFSREINAGMYRDAREKILAHREFTRRELRPRVLKDVSREIRHEWFIRNGNGAKSKVRKIIQIAYYSIVWDDQKKSEGSKCLS